MKKLASTSIMVILLIIGLTACDENNNIVLFSIQDDIELGMQVSNEIENDPNFELLSRTQYQDAYGYLDAMIADILNSGEVTYKDEFPWQVTIVKDDSTLNAFAAPGGYLYVYTGLIKYLNNADALAGVMGHEIAHADLRHTSRNLQKAYGVQVLLSLLLGENPGQLEQIAAQIAGTAAGLSFSREFETEADSESVIYLGPTDYACNGAAFFFEQLEALGQAGGVPEFLSTHPNPVNRVENINNQATEVGCSTALSNEDYAAFQASLP